MFTDTTGCGGRKGRHSWLLDAMVDMATYAERNGLAKLHEHLCHAVSVAATGELADCFSNSEESQADTAANVVRSGSFRQQLV